MIPIRKLNASEIECRVAQCGKNKNGAWCSILLYKDARVDMKILDETYGPMNWQREHNLIGDRLYCTISIWDEEKKTWIKKQDVGTESYTEKEKGQASDSFKRAGFNIGIGRELYTAPKIFINLSQGEYKESGDKIYPSISLDVKEIHYDGDGTISHLVLVDSKTGGVKFSYGNTPSPNPTSLPQKEMMHRNHPRWNGMLKAVIEGKTTFDEIKKKFYFPEADEIEAKQYVLEHQL